MKTQATLSILTALSASLCCIGPILAITAGTSSIASSFSWVEPFRPYLIAGMVVVLGFAWFQAFRPAVDECGCEPRRSFFQSKGFLGIVTVFSLLLVTFPSYSRNLFQSEGSLTNLQDQNDSKKIELAVKGMTCTSCELHIESEVKKLPGVLAVKASYEKGSAVVEYNDQKVKKEEIIAAINSTGYSVDGVASSAMLAGKENCTATSCQVPTGDLPKTASKEVVELNDISQIKNAFNSKTGKTKFVAILSSTCKWCLLGAASIQKGVIENMAAKDVEVIIVWTNMLQSDGKSTAFRAASLFDKKKITQFFDAENKFGDVAARAINSSGKQAWDIYMYFDKDAKWNDSMPRPFEYVHQLGPTNTWADPTKYFCGQKLTDRLTYLTKAL